MNRRLLVFKFWQHLSTTGAILLAILVGCSGGDDLQDRASSEAEDRAVEVVSEQPPVEVSPPPVAATNLPDANPKEASLPETPLEPLPEIPLPGQKTWEEMDDPSRDGWYTEVLAEEAGKHLKKLAGLLTKGGQNERVAIDSLLSEDVTCQPLAIAPNERLVYQDGTLHVQRTEDSGSDRPADSDPHRGVAAVAGAISALSDRFSTTGDRRAKFKIFRVEQHDGGFTTHQFLTFVGSAPGGRQEAHATWIIRWAKRSEYAKARIARIVVEANEFSETRDLARPLLADCTAAVLGQTPAYQEQLRRGLNYWMERCQQRRHSYVLGTPGVAVGDVNGDGLDDLYLCQEQGLPNHLFLQQEDGTVEEVSASWGVNWTNDSRGVLLADWDNDGDQDLAVAMLGGVAIAVNDRQTGFTMQTMLKASDDTMSLAAADYDRDGDLDLFVCGYTGITDDSEPTGGIPGAASNFVYHDANDGAPNALFQNDGTGNFTDVTVQAGLDVNNRRFSMAAAWEDYDNDGDLDLYVANDYGRDNLYENQDGTFKDVGPQAQVEDSASGMSISWGDFNRDGLMDAYVSNMFSSAGNRIAFQQRFREGLSEQVKRRLQRFARGNTLLQNLDASAFQDVSHAAGVEMGRWAWSSNFVDLNNDGWEDILVANGYVTDDDDGDL
ncbi:MAG: VCBS repeat-containing protein [Planctomycetota bacterium]|nr:MAG: VCBS repeat-containing protein [Planctomycetota bacterium]REJ93780.1 MAG: VCBS repeat-containing protein [Planctomycetota bacterium]REK29940.1 MAG: VCBS repeat-containing protein [Planctomycetota bacterium]REK47890.1 MAG: VCBS repeat-containing protein [Planctomycetota bacterium]